VVAEVTGSRRNAVLVVVATALATVGILSAAGGSSRAALPAGYGGSLRLPAPAPVRTLDPARVATPFDAALVAAVCDPLYEIGPRGEARPVLAQGLPEIDGRTARIRLRAGVRRHEGTPLRAVHVTNSLSQAAASPRARWLLGGFASARGEPTTRVIADDVFEIDLARDWTPEGVARVLAASPLLVAGGRDRGRRPYGTGPFTARLVGAEVHLAAFRFAAEGAPYVADIRVLAPSHRDAALRAFELGRADFSWHGESLYGGRPVRPVETTTARSGPPVMLVPSGRLRSDDGALGRIARAIDRRRLERVGLVASATLGAGLPAVPTPAAAAAPSSVRMPVVAGDGFSIALAEALAGQLDEAGITLRIEPLDLRRYAAAVGAGRYDLRVATVLPPLPGPTALAGAALAEAGHESEARALVAAGRLDDPARGAAAMARLRVIVLGHRRIALSHRADLAGVRFDARGRLDLAGLSLPRGAREEP
jgi:ABC-type transport system substrate-binding protein